MLLRQRFWLCLVCKSGQSSQVPCYSVPDALDTLNWIADMVSCWIFQTPQPKHAKMLNSLIQGASYLKSWKAMVM